MSEIVDSDRRFSESDVKTKIRLALEEAAKKVEELAGNNRHYQAVTKRAAYRIRALKPD